MLITDEERALVNKYDEYEKKQQDEEMKKNGLIFKKWNLDYLYDALIKEDIEFISDINETMGAITRLRDKFKDLSPIANRILLQLKWEVEYAYEDARIQREFKKESA